MQNLFKYFIYFVFCISLASFYFVFTPHGNKTAYTLIGKQISKKAGLHIEVQYLNIRNYPQVHIVMNIQKKAKLTLWGHLDDALVNLDYNLTSDCIASDICEIDDNISIRGNVQGPFTKLSISGKGTALDGNVTYSAIKYTDKAENIDIQMRDVNSTKLFKLLGQTAFIKGKADADVHFSMMSENHKKGHIIYDIEDKNYKGVPLDLHSKVDIINEKHTFIIDVHSPYFTLNILKGKYDQKKKRAHAFYTLDVKDLSKLELLLGYKYHGDFLATGEISYDRFFKLTGLSKSFGGLTEFILENDGLKVHLENILFEKIMTLFPFTPMLTANATGDIYYNLIQETLIVNTRLNNAKFIPSKLVDVIRDKSKVDLLKENFNDSNLDLAYHNSQLLGDLELTNEYSHVYLTSTIIDTNASTINAYFDFKMQQQEFSGKVFGSLDNPDVNLNMQKLIRYQMDKQVDKMIGKNNRKIMENMPMGNVAKDVATDMGASFIKVFF